VTLLNHRLADAVDLQTQIKQAHWNVKGPSFIAPPAARRGVRRHLRIRRPLAGRIVQLGALPSERASGERSEVDEYR
jgi:starvation-inducible DNA-binding protein